MSSPTDTPPFLTERSARALGRAERAHAVYWGVIAGLAIGIIGVAVWALWPAGETTVATVSHATPEMPEQVVARDNLVHGSDSASLPFAIDTVRGYQDKDDKSVYHLEDLSGKFRRDNGKDLHVEAETGLYRSNDKRLDLDGKVVISEAPRFEAHMDSATINVSKRTLESHSPVAVTLENGHIAADSLFSEDNGKRMLFKGNVKAHFEGSDTAAAAAADDGGIQ